MGYSKPPRPVLPGPALFLPLFLMAGLTLAPAANAGQVLMGSLIPGSSGIATPVRSFQAQKFASTIEQQFDFSCGSAALATLLTYSYNRPATEQQVFSGMFTHGDKKLIENSGFSLLDMKEYLASQNIDSAGFRAPLDKLAEVSLPAIVLINESGYNHFVVIRGFRDGNILLADPAVGMRTESVKRFQSQWSGIFFLILADVSQAQDMFRKDNGWTDAPIAPFGIMRYSVTLATLQQVGIPSPGSF